MVQILVPNTPETPATALWAALEEVENLYNSDRDRASFQRRLAAARAPRGLAQKRLGAQFARLDPSELPRLWIENKGAYVGTIDQEAVAKSLRERFDVDDDALLLAVTDRELTPPAGFRYILWDVTRHGAVVSTAAMDPAYWGIDDPDRAQTIKQRARAACMAALGIMLGLDRCDNEQCYLYREVDSVLRLDLMVSIGPEHPDFAHEEAVGYRAAGDDPAAVGAIESSEVLGFEGWAPV